jgi:hypothetical protein
MGEQVVYRDKGYVTRPGKCFGKVKAHKKRTEQARVGGCGASFYILNAKAGPAKGFVGDAVDPFGVHTAGDFRNYALPGAVKGNLCGNNIGENDTVSHYCGGAFIAGSFDSKDGHAVLYPSFAPV